jgi:hypothetical protein
MSVVVEIEEFIVQLAAEDPSLGKRDNSFKKILRQARAIRDDGGSPIFLMSEGAEFLLVARRLPK